MHRKWIGKISSAKTICCLNLFSLFLLPILMELVESLLVEVFHLFILMLHLVSSQLSHVDGCPLPDSVSMYACINVSFEVVLDQNDDKVPYRFPPFVCRVPSSGWLNNFLKCFTIKKNIVS